MNGSFSITDYCKFQKMERYFKLDADMEEALWEKGVIIFDTSAICAMYNLNWEARRNISEIIRFLKEKIWLPGHVVYEYNENRIEAINDVIRKNNSQFNIRGIFSSAFDSFDNFIKKINCNDFSPHFTEVVLTQIKQYRRASEDQYHEACKLIKKELNARTEELKLFKDADCIHDAFSSVRSGVEFTYDKILEIAEEGEFRYKHKIPPGYMDADKIGTQRFGDLIIWKEVLAYAKENHCPVVFVCNDVKEDYYERNGKLPATPRHELIKEFVDKTGEVFWMYQLSSFIEKLNIIYKSDPETIPLFTGLECIVDTLRHKEKEEYNRNRKKSGLVLCCENCQKDFEVFSDEMDFEWESNGVCERSMGIEKEYISNAACTCPHCGSEVNLIFSVWEYPVGAFNYQSIDADGAEVVNEINLENKISLLSEDY